MKSISHLTLAKPSLCSYSCFSVLAEFNHYEVFWGKRQCFVQEATEKCFTSLIAHYVPAAIEAETFLKTRKVFCPHSSTHVRVVISILKHLVRLMLLCHTQDMGYAWAKLSSPWSAFVWTWWNSYFFIKSTIRSILVGDRN